MSGRAIKRLVTVGLALMGFIAFTGSCANVTDAEGSASAATLSPAQVNEGLNNEASKPISREQPARRIGESTKIQVGQITGVDMGQVFTVIQTNRVLLVDCRPPIFYRLGHIDGSINLPLKSYDKVIDDRKMKIQQALAEKKIIVLYCQNVKCPDAYAVAKKLALLGHSVSVYKGGWEEWKQAGL